MCCRILCCRGLCYRFRLKIKRKPHHWKHSSSPGVLSKHCIADSDVLQRLRRSCVEESCFAEAYVTNLKSKENHITENIPEGLACCPSVALQILMCCSGWGDLVLQSLMLQKLANLKPEKQNIPEILACCLCVALQVLMCCSGWGDCWVCRSFCCLYLVLQNLAALHPLIYCTPTDAGIRGRRAPDEVQWTWDDQDDNVDDDDDDETTMTMTE